MNPYNFSVLCFGFCSLLLGLLVWLRKNDDVGWRYFVMSLAYAGWAISIAVNLNNDVSSEIGLFAGRLGNAFAVLIPVTWFHFVLVFVARTEAYRYFLKWLYGISIALVSFSFTPWFISHAIPLVGFKYYSQAGPLFFLSAFLFFSIVPMSFFELYRKMGSAGADERQRLLGLFWTSFVGYAGGSMTFFPIYGVPVPQYGLFVMPIYPFALAYFMTKQKLFDAEEFAQAAHRDKLMSIGVLAASINHEVKNPLFIIKGLAESCLERQREGVFQTERKALESSNDAMKRSIDQANRAMDIIKRLSLFAKAGIESELQFESVSVQTLFEDILSLVRHELAAHGIALTKDIPVDLPEVCADRRYLEEIFFNLIVNAIQALKEKTEGGVISISAAAQEGMVQVTIQDNGPGIPEDKLKDVFRPFYTTKAEGTGLGLYITQQLVEKIRGRICVKSTEGKGAIFELVFGRAVKP